MVFNGARAKPHALKASVGNIPQPLAIALLKKLPSLVVLEVSAISGVTTSPRLIRLCHLQHWRIAPETVSGRGEKFLLADLIPHPVKIIADKKGPASFGQAKDLGGGIVFN